MVNNTVMYACPFCISTSRQFEFFFVGLKDSVCYIHNSLRNFLNNAFSEGVGQVPQAPKQGHEQL